MNNYVVIYQAPRLNYTQTKKFVFGQKLAAFMLACLILVSVFSGIYPIKAQGNFFPTTPPVTPPITPPIPTISPFIPTPTATPTAIPPISPPITNQPPVIITDKLKSGIINNYYRAIIVGYDQDYGEALVMRISRLPPGFKEPLCDKNITIQGSSISCQIEGIPTGAKTYAIKVTLEDNHGGIDKKTLTLRISKPAKIYSGFKVLIAQPSGFGAYLR